MKRRSAAVWVENEIMGELVPPELDYLVSSKAASASLSENYVGLPY